MLRVAHVLSKTVTAADDDNDTIARMRNNVSPMVGDRGVGDELTDERDRWSPCVSRIVTVVVVVVIVIICLLSIVAVDLLLVVLAGNIMLCIYRRHCSRHRRHRATETWRLGLAVTSKRNAKVFLMIILRYYVALLCFIDRTLLPPTPPPPTPTPILSVSFTSYVLNYLYSLTVNALLATSIWFPFCNISLLFFTSFLFIILVIYYD